MKNNFSTFLYTTVISLVISLSLSVLFVTRPYRFIDTDTSKIICSTGSSFDMGPNYLYSFKNMLDSFNDLQARKLCAYGIIRDFENAYENPEEVNYKVEFVTKQESSWLRAFFLFFLSMFGGILTIKLIHKKLRVGKTLSMGFLTCIVFISLFLLLVVMRPVEKRLFCFGRVTNQVMNFRNSAYKNGVFRSKIQENKISKSADTFYKSCLNTSI